LPSRVDMTMTLILDTGCKKYATCGHHEYSDFLFLFSTFTGAGTFLYTTTYCTAYLL
jgi:hypothetical protein